MAKDKDKDPSEDPSDAVNEFMNMFGSKKEAEDFMGDAELVEQQMAWGGIYEMYKGLQTGGFSSAEAMELIVIYIIKIVGGL